MIKYIVIIIILFYNREMVSAQDDQDPNYLTIPPVNREILHPNHHPFRSGYYTRACLHFDQAYEIDEQKNDDSRPIWIVSIVPIGEPVRRSGWVWECLWKWCCCCWRRND